jgi:predicted acylesterase/phospholipase RssA
MRQKTRDEHLFNAGPKRLLSLDGGGVRGIASLAYLDRIERLLRDRCGGDPEFRLCDYFDLICGTSTGAIIAAAIAVGFPVERIIQLYRTMIPRLFVTPRWRLGLRAPKYSHAPLARVLEETFGDITLGSDRVRTGLVIVTKRFDTGSPWFIHNNPRGKYYDLPDAPNKDFLLRDVVRASTAAAPYFGPERLRVGGNVEGVFIDGGVSPYNNPALQLLMMATLEGFGLGWPVGPDQLFLVSVGTGSQSPNFQPDRALRMPSAMIGLRSVRSVIADSSWFSQTILQWISRSPAPWQIDREVGDLTGDLLGDREWLSYIRYDLRLEAEWLAERLGERLDVDRYADGLKDLAELDNPESVDALAELGEAAAAVQVDGGHFPESFDL